MRFGVLQIIAYSSRGKQPVRDELEEQLEQMTVIGMQPSSWQRGVMLGFRITSMPWKCRITSMIASRKGWWRFIVSIMRGT
jgi:hypothetical protein